MLFNKNLTKQEKLDFLEYLSFQIKSEMSFEKCLIRYLDNNIRSEKIIRKCNEAIDLIRNGESPANALLYSGFIEKFEYGIVKNAASNKDLYVSLLSILNINKSNLKNSNKLKSAIKSGVLTFCSLLFLIPFFKNDIAELYGTFGQMQGLTNSSGVVQKIELPFLIQYWWGSFVVLGFVAILWFGTVMFINYLYKNNGALFYRIFRNKLYMDLISVLKTFYQLQQSMSISKAYKAMANSSPNSYWENLFLEIDEHAYNGGKASEIFINQKGIIPIEVINSLIDGEETSQMKLYTNKAIEYCEIKNEEINQIIKEWAPTIINLILFAVVGVIVVLFVKDIMQNGIMDVMSKI